MAGRYALALFSLAREQHATDEVAAALKTFDQMIADSPDLQRLVRSPVFSAATQTQALGALLDKAGISGVAANFIKLTAAKRRLFAIRDMIANFNKLNDSYRGVARAEVTTAAPLSDAHVAAIKEALKGVTGGKDVEISTKTDPSIIGSGVGVEVTETQGLPGHPAEGVRVVDEPPEHAGAPLRRLVEQDLTAVVPCRQGLDGQLAVFELEPNLDRGLQGRLE